MIAPVLVRLALGLFALLFSPESPAQQTSDEFFSQLSTVLKTREGRDKVKVLLNKWSPQQKAEFSESLQIKIRASVVPRLPLQIDRVTLLRSILATNNAIFLNLELAEDSGIDLIALMQQKDSVKNYVCTTPVNALLLLVGYRFFMTYYDHDSKYLTQLQYSADTCEL